MMDTQQSIVSAARKRAAGSYALGSRGIMRLPGVAVSVLLKSC
jgi:hypothetical protein